LECKRLLKIAFPTLAIIIIAALFIPPRIAEAGINSPLISAPDGTLFLIYDNARHAVTPSTLAALGIDEHTTKLVSRQLFDTLSERTAIPELPQGSLVTGPEGWPYLLLDGLRPIPDEETFYASGWGGYQKFGPTPVATIEPGLFALLPKRAPLEGAKRTGPGLFEWGNCTWWVAQRRAVTWLGNGGEWYANAKAQGYAVGNLPLPGSILVRGSSAYNGYGHVAYVESVDGTQFTVSEMNVSGLGQLTTRTYDIVSNPPPSMIGFVYWRFGPESTEAKIETPTTLSPAVGLHELP
jgi:hypothetical protein